MKRISLFSIASLCVLLWMAGCSEGTQSAENHTDHSAHSQQEAPAQSGTVTRGDIPAAQVQEILTTYLEVKDALVQTDGAAAQMAVGELLGALGEDDGMAGIRLPALAMVETDDPKVQREHFFQLSQQVYDLVKASGANESPVYRQYCPMAFNNTGAFWLAAEKEINNPYFGDMMLHCGKVEEEL